MFWRDLWTSMTTCFMAISGGINWQTVYEPLNQLDANMGKIFIAAWPTEWPWKLVLDYFLPGWSGKLDRPGEEAKHHWRLGGEMWVHRESMNNPLTDTQDRNSELDIWPPNQAGLRRSQRYIVNVLMLIWPRTKTTATTREQVLRTDPITPISTDIIWKSKGISVSPRY